MKTICTVCPRKCNIDRSKTASFCGATNQIKVAKVMLHYWEEPIISGDDTTINKGSGAIFFSGCNLKCIYCQNEEISNKGIGKEISTETLASLFKQLENAGACNINLVTPTMFTNQIINALKIYRPKCPIIWNTSGFERAKTIKMLKKYVDIYLTDIKYFSTELSSNYSYAPTYFSECSKAVLQMRTNQPLDIIENGLMKKGIIIRHLVLPEAHQDSIKILEWIKENLGNQTYISIMSQYTPCGRAKSHSILKNKLKPIEYKIVISHLNKLGFENGFIQDTASATKEFIPEFCNQSKEFKF